MEIIGGKEGNVGRGYKVGASDVLTSRSDKGMVYPEWCSREHFLSDSKDVETIRNLR
jgi:hypothetical protein